MKHRTVVIMLKLPQPGRVKTRLAADIGSIQATWWFRHQTHKLIRRLDNDPRWNLVLAVAPDCAGLSSPIWPAHIPRIPQGNGNLGDRMTRIFAQLRKGPTMIVGADIPNINSALISEGFRKLGRNEAIIGPAPDGGYWTIGLRQGVTPPPKMLFSNVRWSSRYALKDAIKNIENRRIAKLPMLQDVDRVTDLDQI